MKEFKNLDSAKIVKAVVDKQKEVNTMMELIPDVDIIAKVSMDENINQYVISDEVYAMTDFRDIEDYHRFTDREIEIKREGSKLVYKIVENGEEYIGTADLNTYRYTDAVMIARSRALIRLEETKINRVIWEQHLLKMSKPVELKCIKGGKQ